MATIITPYTEFIFIDSRARGLLRVESNFGEVFRFQYVVVRVLAIGTMFAICEIE